MVTRAAPSRPQRCLRSAPMLTTPPGASLTHRRAHGMHGWSQCSGQCVGDGIGCGAALRRSVVGGLVEHSARRLHRMTQPAVLVTGGAGYVGSHVCKALHRSGLIPVTLDNLSTGHRKAVQWGPLEVGDVRDEGLVSEVMGRHNATAVLHFAALSLVGESAGKPLEYYENNVLGTFSLV